MEPPTYLKEKNPHERDNRILFDEPTHVYTIDGDSDYMSVTTFNHALFEHFNADKIIKNMRNSKNWITSKYYGMSDHQIKALWDKNRDEAAQAGACTDGAIAPGSDASLVDWGPHGCHQARQILWHSH